MIIHSSDVRAIHEKTLSKLVDAGVKNRVELRKEKIS